ncbi:hypothetical protein HGRIS_001469 [Hohenbuehelia grisea]|uniref:Uncharacterized protein n=1 Tax=Hohenbuehelia grisea TaxID=104357 RepID=A0ABR3JQN6_9AGAR
MHLLQRAKAQQDAAVTRYRVARTALLSQQTALGKDRAWQVSLKVLQDEDIRGLTSRDMENVATPAERNRAIAADRRRPISWIWLNHRVISEAQNNAALHDSLRVEWCRSRARALRWCEEVELLKEEMRRVLAFFDSESRWWLEQRGRRVGLPILFNSHTGGTTPDLQEGLEAYAARQADIRQRMRNEFARMWNDIPRYLEFYTPFEDSPPTST